MSAAGKNQQRLMAPDVLRVSAIFLVAWFHIWQQSWLDPGFRIGPYYIDLQQVIRHGYMMVDETLLLSGFLLALPAARRRMEGDGTLHEPAAVFYRKRFWRIVPSYVLMVALFFLWALAEGQYGTGFLAVKDLWAHLTFTHTFFYSSYQLTPLSGVLWTLAVEMQFYLLWPALERIFTKRPAETCLVMIAAAFSFRAWVYGEQDCSMYFNQLPAQLDLYACGMAAAAIFARAEKTGLPGRGHRRVIAPVGMVLALAGMGVIMYLQPVGDYESIRHGQMSWRLPLGLLGAAFLLCGCMAPEGLSRALGNRVTRFLADVSFNYYMIHQFLACRLKDWHIPPYTDPLPNQAYEQPWQMQYTFLCFFAALALAALVTYLWERPVRRWALGGTREKKTSAVS